MTIPRLAPPSIAFALGATALALILGALGFEYLDHLPPCEMCMWQRYPHAAAAVVGIGGFLLAHAKLLPEKAAAALAVVAALLIAVSGLIGAYHAGVEWHLVPGPQACTGGGYRYSGGTLDLDAPIVMCDHAAWRLLGLSLAGYNALISLAIAGCGVVLVGHAKRTS